MPAIQATRQAASSIATTLKNGRGAILARDVAERCFLPAFAQATATIPIPRSTNTVPASPPHLTMETRRNFSGLPVHEHDKVRWQGNFLDNGDSSDLIDYWKAHQHEHINLYRSELVDYWMDHMNTHNDMDSTTLCQNAMHRRFSTRQSRRDKSPTVVAASKVSGGGDEIDYWTRHGDSHYTDYWEEQPNAHL